MNWFLYIVTSNFLDSDGELMKPGEAGVGQCSMEPGIMEAPYGTMYIITPQDVKHYFRTHNIKQLTARTVRLAIENYYFRKPESDSQEEMPEFIFD